MAVARKQMGAPAIYHQDFAGNCFEERCDELCLSAGLGPAFDCSGLVVASVCRVLGVSTAEWRDLRHVRDMWQAATRESRGSITCAPVIGSLLVTKRMYTIAGQDRVVPGHIGIITAINKENIRFLHANPKAGRVEEVWFNDTERTLGYLSLVGAARRGIIDRAIYL